MAIYRETHALHRQGVEGAQMGLRALKVPVILAMTLAWWLALILGLITGLEAP